MKVSIEQDETGTWCALATVDKYRSVTTQGSTLEECLERMEMALGLAREEWVDRPATAWAQFVTELASEALSHHQNQPAQADESSLAQNKQS